MGFPRRDDLDPECVQRHYDALTTGLPVHVGRTRFLFPPFPRISPFFSHRSSCSRDGRGYGLYASRNFESDEEVFVEKALAGMQQAENRAHVLACAHCHRFVGSLPLQAGLLGEAQDIG